MPPEPIERIAERVRMSFLIVSEEKLFGPFEKFQRTGSSWRSIVVSAVEGLESVASAGCLPFQLVHDSVQQRRFDRFHSAESIRCLVDVKPGADLTEELKVRARENADRAMIAFVNSEEGQKTIRDEVLHELDHRLRSITVKNATQELLVQTLISTWSVFESFARSFVVAWVNADPQRASAVLSSLDLKDFFGKQVVDLEVIGKHGFDLSTSMGKIVFEGRKLDNLTTIRAIMKALFNEPEIQLSLDKEMWFLNQRRHLFVHKRGVVDEEYLLKTGDGAVLGNRLTINAFEIERYLGVVSLALQAISNTVDSLDEKR
jgi:hypothetical protein